MRVRIRCRGAASGQEPARGSFWARRADPVREKRAAIRVAVASVACTLFVVAASVVGWRLYAHGAPGESR